MDLDTSLNVVETGPELESGGSEIRDGGRFPRSVGYGRSRSLDWADGVKNGRDFLNMVRIPPVCAILHRDILERGWGWERVVPYRPGDVEWPEFKEYLADFFKKTDKAIFGKWRPEPGQSVEVASEHDSLTAAVDLCLKNEKELLMNFFDDFNIEDILLSSRIRDRAIQLSNLGCVSSVAATALLCITKEAELMCELLGRRFETSKVVKFCNKIRRSASNLMLCTGSESDDAAAAAGAMLGIAKESAWILDVLASDYPYAYVEYLVSDKIRKQTATVLTKFEQELGCETAGTDGDGTRKGRANTAGDLNFEGSASRENSKEYMNTHSEMNMNTKGGKMTANMSSNNKVVAIKKLEEVVDEEGEELNYRNETKLGLTIA